MIAVAAPVPAIVVLAAQRTLQAERGVVGFRLHRVFEVHAGPYGRHDDLEFAGVYEDGRLLKVRVLHQQIGGRETDEGTKAKTAAGYEHPAPGDVFARPFDAPSFPGYTYEMADPHTVRFIAIARDSAHGDGTFVTNAAGDVLSIQYTPDVMPQYARSGSVADERAEVLPGYWAMTREVQQYSGRYAIFRGGATVTITQSAFVRFPDTATAIAALDAGRI